MSLVDNVLCREGTGWLMRMMERVVNNDVTRKEIELLEEVTRQIEGHTICALGDAALLGRFKVF